MLPHPNKVRVGDDFHFEQAQRARQSHSEAQTHNQARSAADGHAVMPDAGPQQVTNVGLHVARAEQDGSIMRAVYSTDRQHSTSLARGNNTCWTDGLVPCTGTSTTFQMLQLKFEVCNSMYHRRLRTGKGWNSTEMHQRTLHFEPTHWVLLTESVNRLSCYVLLYLLTLCYTSRTIAQIRTALCCSALSTSTYLYNTPR